MNLKILKKNSPFVLNYQKKMEINYGTVLTVVNGVVQIYGMNLVQAGEMVEFVDSHIKGLSLNLDKKINTNDKN